MILLTYHIQLSYYIYTYSDTSVRVDTYKCQSIYIIHTIYKYIYIHLYVDGLTQKAMSFSRALARAQQALFHHSTEGHQPCLWVGLWLACLSGHRHSFGKSRNQSNSGSSTCATAKMVINQWHKPTIGVFNCYQRLVPGMTRPHKQTNDEHGQMNVVPIFHEEFYHIFWVWVIFIFACFTCVCVYVESLSDSFALLGQYRSLGLNWNHFATSINYVHDACISGKAIRLP